MLKPLVGTIAGIVGWIIIVTLIDRAIRYGWADYALVEKAMTFTLPMMIARLAESGVSSLAGGAIAAWIARGSAKGRWAALASGVIVLLFFLPFHVTIWDKFPVWYHLTFLTSLPLLGWAGGKLLAPKA